MWCCGGGMKRVRLECVCAEEERRWGRGCCEGEAAHEEHNQQSWQHPLTAHSEQLLPQSLAGAV